MQLLLEHHRASLLANGARTARGEDIDPFPVVKLSMAEVLTREELHALVWSTPTPRPPAIPPRSARPPN